MIGRAVADALIAQLAKVVNPPPPKAPTAQFPISPGTQMPNDPGGTAMPPPPNPRPNY